MNVYNSTQTSQAGKYEYNIKKRGFKMKMYEHILTIGLYDKDTKVQEIEAETAKNIISDELINHFNIYAFTMMNAYGVYKMNDGSIVKEPSVRLEIADNDLTKETIYRIIKRLKTELNQESIMYKMVVSDIDFI